MEVRSVLGITLPQMNKHGFPVLLQGIALTRRACKQTINGQRWWRKPGV